MLATGIGRNVERELRGSRPHLGSERRRVTGCVHTGRIRARRAFSDAC
jgi:hypothetical protein